MRRNILLAVIFLLALQKVNAQKATDTLTYYLKNSGEIIQSKDSADFIEIILPYDKETRLYPVYMYYPNGKRRLIGAAKSRDIESLTFDGPCTQYYPNGNRQRLVIYSDGKITGDHEEYYPNGKLYCIKNTAVPKAEDKLIECRDSTGKILAQNGNGYWIKLDEDLKEIISGGNVGDGFEEGEWHGSINDTGKFVCTYQKGKVVSGKGYDALGREHPFTEIETKPVFDNEKGNFDHFLFSRIKNPESATKHHIRGSVTVYFMIEKDGTVNHVRTRFKYAEDEDHGLFAIAYHDMCTAAVDAVKLSPLWIPGTKYGMPVRTRMTIPIRFVPGRSGYDYFHL